MARKAPFGFALLFVGASLMGASSCVAPEVKACYDFVDALRECTDRNGGASGSAEGDGHEACEDVDPACEGFFECAAGQPCAKDPVGDFWKIDASACAMPEGVNCVSG